MNRQIVLSFWAVGVLGSLAGCSYSDTDGPEKGQQMPQKTIEQVQEAHTDEWMAIPGVEGTAIGLSEGKPCIKVFSSVKAQELQAKIPSTVDGYSVVIEETGAFRALGER